MKARFVLATVAGVAAAGVLAVLVLQGREAAPAVPAPVIELLQRQPMHFEPVAVDPAAPPAFASRGPGYLARIEPQGLRLRLGHELARAPDDGRKAGGAAPRGITELDFQLLGSNPAAPLSGADPQPGRSHYFIGADPAGWRRNVANFGRVQAEDVYAGIDLVYYGNGSRLEYDFIVAPGADPSAIRFRYEGAQGSRIDAEGNLVLSVPGGELVQHKPVVYQEVAGARRAVEGRYRMAPDQSIGFELAAYDAGTTLVIDPILSYSTYLGGSASDSGLEMAVDSAGNVYVVGQTGSTDFGTAAGPNNTIEGDKADFDAFIAKINADGSALVYLTYLGGSDFDAALDVAVDSSGNAYVTGYTDSSDFSTTPLNRLEADEPGRDAFVAKINPAGDALVYATYLGGNDADLAYGIAVDGSGHAYVTGTTESTDFGTAAGPNQTLDADETFSDAFVAKLSPDGSALLYSSYLGGDGGDQAFDIAVDASGHAYITGETSSTDFGTAAGPNDRLEGNSLEPFGAISRDDAFIAKINPEGTGLVWSTYLGGFDRDVAYGIDVDGAGNVYIAGYTFSTVIGTAAGPNDTLDGKEGGYDAFVAKIAASGDQLFYSTHLGGQGNDFAYDIAADEAGHAYVTGVTRSSNFGTSVGPNSTLEGPEGLSSAFVAKINPSGSALVYSTYLGGSDHDLGYGIDIDAAGNVYVAGDTSSSDFGVVGAPGNTLEGDEAVGDVFIAKLVDTPVSGSLQFTRAAVLAAEAGGPVTLTVTRTGSAAREASIFYYVAPLTASPASDFSGASSRLVWPAGDTSPRTISIGITADTDAESSEEFIVTLADPVGDVVRGEPAVTTVTILDDDAASLGSLAFDRTAYEVDEAGGTVTLTVIRSVGNDGAIGVNYSAAAGTAGTADFGATSGTLAFADGETLKTFTVPILNDSSDEPAETFSVTLTAPSGGAVLGSPASASVTLLDDDLPPVDDGTPEPEDGGGALGLGSLLGLLAAAAGALRTRRARSAARP